MQDFQTNYGRYELKAVSRSLRTPGLAFVFILIAIAVLLFAWLVVKIGPRLAKGKSQEDSVE
jgi:hypothetical protein